MNTVIIDSSKKYNIHIGSGLMNKTGEYCLDLLKGKNILILSDDNVWPIFGKAVQSSLENVGYSVCSYIIPAGETSKSGDTFLSILNFLAAHQLTRADCIIALGGGVVGDLAGFVAATYLRGIDYIQIPTSLLAMVDSSVGGKTAIDLPAGKNLVGAFYQPNLVLCDLDALNTLPKDVFLDGCAEIIKYGILFDENLFTHLKEMGPAFNRKYVVTRCVELKRDIVHRDEREHGERQLLNLGHTIGHSIEAISNYRISHGKAVAIGTNLITACAAAAGLSIAETFTRVNDILQKFGLPTKTGYNAAQLSEIALKDKKRANEIISLILPRKIGQCEIYPYPIEKLQTFIKAGQTYADSSIPR